MSIDKRYVWKGVSRMKRIAVIGCGGAGKSTFSQKLANILNIPVYHLDKLYWKPGWVESSKEEWDELIKKLVFKQEWIIDGNYSRTIDVRLKNADTIIFLNMPTYLCIYRIIKRRLMYRGKSRPDMNEGCKEKLHLDFVKWVYGYNRNIGPSILDKLRKYSNEKNIIILNKPAEVQSFIYKLKNNKSEI